jgi:hypothetical protein
MGTPDIGKAPSEYQISVVIFGLLQPILYKAVRNMGSDFVNANQSVLPSFFYVLLTQ